MSRQDDLQKLITNYGRRLQKLREQQALRGLDTPPHILIEIEDVQAKITELEAKLVELRAAELEPVPLWTQNESIPLTVQSMIRAETQYSDASDPAIFIGRQAQLAELERHWQEVYYQQRGKIVFLVGEAGIGKTRLVQRFSHALLANYPNAQYASAGCDQLTGDISAYAPFIQLLNNLTQQAARRGQHWTVEFIREIGPDVLNMIPVAGSILAMAAKSVDFAWQRRPRSADSDTDEIRVQFGQQDIFQQFTNTFRNIARKKSPLLLFIDDWHWADTSSTSLLFHLSRQLNGIPILLLATYRPHDAQARQHPILTIRAEMERYGVCDSIALDFFNREDIIAYLARRFPQSHFETGFIDWLLDITNGNALFITEYVNLLLKEKLLTDEGHLTGSLDQILPPANVEAVIRSRIGYLDREARDMLAYGSVEGEQFTTLVLSRLLDLKPLQLLQRLRAIEEVHQLISSLGPQRVYDQQTTVYQFIHTLIHRTLYNTLEVEERAEIHRLLLGLEEPIFAEADEATKAKLAPDLMSRAAEAGDYLAQARYAIVAARDAARRYAHTEVLKHSTIGLQALTQVSPAPPELERMRVDLLLLRGKTEEKTGAQQQAFETYYQVKTLAEAAQDKVTLTRVLNKLGWVLRKLGDYDRASDYHQESILLAEEVKDRMELAYACHGLGLIHARRNENEPALELSRKALTIWQDLGYDRGVASIYNFIGGIYRNQGDFREAMQWYQQAIDLNERMGNQSQLAWNYSNIGQIHQDQSELVEAARLYQQALAIWQEQGYRRGEAIAIYNIGRIHQVQGEDEQALVCYQEALAICEELGDRSLIAAAQDSLGQIYEIRAEYSSALNWYQKALSIREDLGNSKHIAESRERIAALKAKMATGTDQTNPAPAR